MPGIAVVIVNYNGGELIHECVKSLQSQSVSPDKIMIVDNGSQDNSLEPLRKLEAGVDIHELGYNSGFAAANNYALKQLQDFDWVALLNPDAMADKDWIKNIHSAIERYSYASSFASCMLDYNDKNIVDGMGDAYAANGKAWPINKGASLKDVENQVKHVFAPCAGAGVYNVSILNKVGGFDESYFCYHEDVDLGFRLNLAGETCIYLPDVIVYHVGSALTGKGSDFSIYHAHRNLVWTFVKNMPLPLLLLYLVPHIYLNAVTVLYFLIVRKRKIILHSKWDALKGLPLAIKSRKSIQASRVVDTETIAKTIRLGKFGRKLFGYKGSDNCEK